MKTQKWNLRFSVFFATLTIFVAAKADLVVLTDRPVADLRPLAESFTLATGETVQFTEVTYPKIKEVLAEPTTIADVVILKDFVFTHDLANQGLLQAFTSAKIETTVPAAFRSTKNLWTGLSLRTRAIIYNPGTVSADSLTGFASLASAEWAGRICVRSGKHPYNQALVAQWLTADTALNVESFVKALVQNLAVDPLASDRAVIEAVAKGDCDVGIANHYYLAPYIDKNPAFGVKILSLNADVHTNGAVGALVKTSKQAKLGALFLEHLLETNNQQQWTAASFDFPIATGVKPTTLVNQWGPINAKVTPWESVAEKVSEAQQVILKSDYR